MATPSCPCKADEKTCCKCSCLLCFQYDDFCIRMLHIVADNRTFCPECYAKVRKELKGLIEVAQSVR